MPKRVESEFKALGTTVYLAIIADEGDISRAEADLAETQKLVRAKEGILSRFDRTSEIYFFNSHLNEWHEASSDLAYLSGRAISYFKESKGLFDPRIIDNLEAIGYRESLEKNDFSKIGAIVSVSGDLQDDLKIEGKRVCFRKRMDFSGIAKGYICDSASAFLKSRGWDNFLADTGGDMFLAGLDENEEKWKIDIEGVGEGRLLFHLSEQAIATSGITRRFWKTEGRPFHHLVNPKRPDDFESDFLSVSMVAETAEKADVWAKIIFFMKGDAKKYIEDNNVPAAIRTKGDYWLSNKMKKFLILTILFFSLSAALPTMAQNQNRVDYQGKQPIDSDLDGLTDQGEIQLYHTDPHNPDTDGDGMLDGAEVINNTDPLDKASFVKLIQDANNASQATETPWVWYAIRASGLIAFFLLYLNIFFGLAIRFPGLNKLIRPIYSFEMHCDLSVHSILFVIPHFVLLVFHRFGNLIVFKWKDVLVPFTSAYKPEWTGFGTVGFYLMLVLILTSYFRRHFSQKIWRAAHFLNIILYFVVIAHSLFLGTDLKGRVPANIFIIANGILFFMFLTSFSVMLFKHFHKETAK